MKEEEIKKLTLFQRLHYIRCDLVGVGIGKEQMKTLRFEARGIDTTLNTCSPMFAKWRVLYTPTLIQDTYKVERVKVNDKMRNYGTAEIEWTFRNVDDKEDLLRMRIPGEYISFDDLGIGKLFSYTLKTSLFNALQIPTKENSEFDPRVDSEDDFDEWNKETKESNELVHAEAPYKPPLKKKTQAKAMKENSKKAVNIVKGNQKQKIPGTKKEVDEDFWNDYKKIRGVLSSWAAMYASGGELDDDKLSQMKPYMERMSELFNSHSDIDSDEEFNLTSGTKESIISILGSVKNDPKKSKVEKAVNEILDKKTEELDMKETYNETTGEYECIVKVS